ncbi:unnamed protein product [Linum trigynum]
MDNNWSFPKLCVKKSGRRYVHAGMYSRHGEKFLKISELCPNGKVFFVCIPAGSTLMAWSTFIKTLRSFITGNKTTTSANDLPPQSYAEAVSGKGFSMNGVCSIAMDGNQAYVKVESDGVEDRLKFLERCVLIRLVGADNGKLFSISSMIPSHNFKNGYTKRGC